MAGTITNSQGWIMRDRQLGPAWVTDSDWRQLLDSRRDAVAKFLVWACTRERTPGRSLRLENRDDLSRVRQVIPLFRDDWWGVVVYSCFDSIYGTRAVAGAFHEPINPNEAAEILARQQLPRGAVQHHRTQPGHRGAKIALISACEHASEIRRVLHDLDGFHQRFQDLVSLPLGWWGRTTCFDLLVRTGVLGIGGKRYEPDRAYLAGSTGPQKGFERVWGMRINAGNAEHCEDVLREWNRRWAVTCSALGVSWKGRPYSTGDFENALCIYQER